MNAAGVAGRRLQARRLVPPPREERRAGRSRCPSTVAELLASGAAGGVLLLMALMALQARGLATPDAARGDLGGGRLRFPVPAASSGAMSNSFADPRGKRVHRAVDIVAPRGSPVVAVDDGTVARLSTSQAGGVSFYQLDPSGRYCFYYAHLEGYAQGLAEGQRVTRGQVVGYVGTTGNASPGTPHLHFAISEVVVKERWCEGRAIDPYPLWP